MLGALYTGITGLNANSNSMSVISNNIANANTVGFQRSSTTFFDILSSNFQGGAANIQVGRGVFMGSVKVDYVQGSLEYTENSTDLSIDGAGFFVTREVGDDTLYYSRNGQFILDKEGYLITTDGLRVRGFGLDNGGVIDYTEQVDLRVDTVVLGAAEATTESSLVLNLNAEAPVYVPNDPETESGQYTATVTTWDSQGRDIPLSYTYTKIGVNTWSCVPSIPVQYGIATAPGAVSTAVAGEALGSGSGPYTLANANVDVGTLVFSDAGGTVNLSPIYSGTPVAGQVLVETDENGVMSLTFGSTPPGGGGWQVDYDYYANTGYPFNVTFSSVGALASPASGNVTVDLHLSTGAATAQTVTTNMSRITQYASASVTRDVEQDGHGAGELQSLNVTEEGIVTGSFTNGEVREVGQLVLGYFRNAHGLTKVGDTRFEESRASGQAIHNVAGTGRSSVLSYSLELSNVDIGTEFVKLITVQRAYTANTKVVSTSDSMLSDLMSIKR